MTIKDPSFARGPIRIETSQQINKFITKYRDLLNTVLDAVTKYKIMQFPLMFMIILARL